MALIVGVALLFARLDAQPRDVGGLGDAGVFVALIESARVGDLDGIERSLQAGADINRLSGRPDFGFRCPALFHALHARQWPAALLLIQRGANVSEFIEKRSPFAWAAQFGGREVAKEIWGRLTEAERNNLLKENNSWVGALEAGHLDVVRDLQALGFVLVNARGGARALDAAVTSGRLDCVEFVLAQKPPTADLNRGALVRAAGFGYVEILERLLAAGADVNAVSPKLPDVTYWFPGDVTPLVAAVIRGEPEAVAVLLKHGADPVALDSGAIRWADLLGDEQSYRLLREAGAPEPLAFSFRDWLPADRGHVASDNEDGGLSSDLATMLASAPVSEGETPTTLVRPTKLAIVPLSAELGGAEALLMARLSEVAGATLLERKDVRHITNERKLANGFGRRPSERSRLGSMLGADALVLLHLSRQGEQPILETRVVSVTTGLVTSVQVTAWDEAEMDAWAEATVRQCAADVPRIFTAPDDVRLVSVMPLSASTSGVEARETERRLTLLLASQLARMPGVFLLERRELDRLRVEAFAEDQELLRSSWLVSGTIEVSGTQSGRVAENILTLRLESGMHGSLEAVRVSGPATEPVALVQAIAKKIGDVFAVKTEATWDPMREARAYAEAGRTFAERRMWAEAQAATEAAWALGIQNDETLQQRRLYAASKRALFDASRVRGVRSGPVFVKDLAGNQQGRINEVTLEDVIVNRAPLMVPSGDASELAMEDYIELSERMLDLLEGKVSAGFFTEQTFQAWASGPVWDAATLPLQLGEALSYQQRYRAEFDELRARLRTVNGAALKVAKAHGYTTEVNTLWGIRARLLPWWQPNEGKFKEEILSVLREAKAAKPAVSGHPVWGSVFESGLAQMDVIGGRASQSWVRLARQLATSTDKEERLMGLAWLSREAQATRAEKARSQVKALFNAVLEEDRAWTGKIWRIANDVTKEPGAGYPATDVAPWYGTALRASLASREKITIVTGSWDPGAGMALRPFPEDVVFDLTSFERKAALMEVNGGSCLLWHYGVSQHFSDEELRRLVAAVQQASKPIATTVGAHPEARNYFMNPPNWIERFQRELADRNSVQRLQQTPELAFGAPRWILPLPGDATQRTLANRAHVIGYHGYRSDGDIWWRASATTGEEVIFRFSPEGELIDRTAHPRRIDGHFYVLGEAWSRSENGGGDVTDRYIAVQARDTSRRELPHFNDEVRLYDRRTREWVTLTAPFPVNMVCDVRVFGEKVYFSYLYNAEVEKTTARNLGDFARKGEPMWGIVEYDIAKKSYRLLVSSRREPQESPLDGGSKEYRDLIRVSPTVLAVGGWITWVYDVEKAVWRKSTPEDLSAIYAARRNPLEVQAGGDVWTVAHSSGTKITFKRKNLNSGKKPLMIKIPVTLNMRAAGHGMDPALVRRVAEAPRFEYHGTPHGVALSGGNFYAWAPLDEVRRVLEEAARRLDE